MTTKEMIEVMEAFERGEEIQWAVRGEGRFVDCKKPDWNWDVFIYIIKPKEKPKQEPKFKVGDKIINKSYCDGGTLSTDDIHTVVELKDDYYITLCDAELNFKFADESCINISDCLWYFEYLDTAGVWRKTACRHNEPSIASRFPTILYQLGARLPKEIK
ncbi:hypothetical protein [Campylobacter fetus]|uniref:hypothetical protein n=1 Tax=Campylobacter fetus TaxID=196 RepID=UPI000818C959|nr:hypothetical protein [Campylobacter fetus]